MKTILEDDREIKQVNFNDEDDDYFAVGCKGAYGSEVCTKIEAYAERGLHCDIPYIAIYCGDRIKRRLPAHMVEIVYE